MSKKDRKEMFRLSCVELNVMQKSRMDAENGLFEITKRLDRIENRIIRIEKTIPAPSQEHLQGV